MKFAGALLALSLLLPAVTAAPEYPHRLATRQNNRNGNGGGRNGGGNGGNGGNNGNNGNNGGGNGGGNGGNGNNNGGNGNNGGNQGGNQGGDPQTSLTLDPSVIQTNLANDGLVAGAEAGQVASLTTTNNFINFCVGKTLTNGQQVVGGSCNPTPMGDIIPQSNMPSAKFLNPPNLAVIPPNQQFTVQLQVNNMQTGFFTNPQASYFGAPQQLQGGVLVAHSHVVIEKIDSLESTQVTNPQNFAFFKGLNAPAQGGVLTADVTNGLAEGVYRMASINTAANHQPALVAVAQHGSLDDIVYFTVSANGGNNGNGNGNGGNGNGNGNGGNGNGDGGAGNGNGNGNGNGGNGNGNGNNGNGNGNNGNGNGNGGNVNATPSDSASVADPAATQSAAVTESAAVSTASVADPAATAPPAAGGNAGNGGNNGNNGNNGRGGNRGGFGRGGFGRGGRGRGGRGRGRF